MVEPGTISRLRYGAELSFAMLAGMELDLFTGLKDGPLTLEQLAASIDVRPAKLRPLAYALVVADLLEVEGDRFSNTLEADAFLVKGGARYMGAMSGNLAFRWSAFLNTAESIRTGAPQAKLDFSAGDEQALERFLRGIHAEAMLSGRELAERHDLSPYRTLADVGGGGGGLAIALTEIFPDLRATVIDLPRVVPTARKIIDEAGAGDRVETFSADVVNGSLTGSYEVAVLRSLVQVLSPEDGRKALHNVHGAMAPGASIHVVARTLDDSRLSPLSSVGFSLLTLNIFEEGQAYTKGEYREWLTEAGFESIVIQPLSAGMDLISGSKPP